MSLTVKVFYEQANGPNEIRRFPVSTGQNVDIFSETKAKIRQLFPSIAHGNFTLYWQDSDGDRVAFSTSEEMKDAMAYTSDGVLRVYVSQSTASPEKDGQKQHKAPGKEQQKQPSDAQTADPGHISFPGSEPNPDGGSYSFNFGPLPPGFPGFMPNSDEGPPPYNFGPVPPVVTCDGCSSQISGLLYKCCNCINYNLCQTCAGKGQHSEHTMLRIPLPNFSFPPFNSQQFNFPPQPSFSFHTFGPGMPAGTYSSTGTFGPGMPAGASYSSTNIFGPGMPTGTFSSTNTTCNSFSGAKLDHNAEKHSDGQTGAKSNQTGFNFHKAGTNIPPSPFGIKVSCNVKDCTKGNANNGTGCNANNGTGCNSNNGTGNKTQENFQHSWWGQGSGCPVWGGMYWGTPQGMAADGQGRGTDEAATKMEGGSKDGAPKNGSNQAENKSGSEGNSQWNEAHAEQIKLQIPTTFAIPLPFPTSISVSMPNPQPTTVTASSPNPAVSPQPTSSSGSAFFTAPRTGHQTNSPNDERIQECLDRMLAMGFSDWDGSLFALLLEHEGDIGSTIDALKAKASQNTGTPRGGR